MNIEADIPEAGQAALQDDQVQADLNRLCAMWGELLKKGGGPLLFGSFGITDAFFAPVVMRINTYGLPVTDIVHAYVQKVTELKAVQSWMTEARSERDFRPFEEPYRSAP